jgi:peptidoglycan-N-acetylglucosamine deacetylase
MKESIPGFVKWIYPKRIWEGPAEDKSIYLTFDDGPLPQVTGWVLEQLKAYDAKATFFCIGENVKRHPDMFRKIIFEGHSIGNHTYNHLNGWKTGTDEYILNTLKCQRVIQKNLPEGRPLKNVIFRPPYGKITNRQAKELQKRGFKVVMWSIVSMDYDIAITAERCHQNVLRNARPGSVIVFHDSLKAQPNLEAVLPKVLEHYSEKGYTFKSLE